MDLIIKPGDLAQNLFDPKAPVTQLEFRSMVEQMQNSVNQMAAQQHLISMRLEALVKGSTYASNVMWEPASTHTGMQLNAGAYFAYLDRFVKAFAPTMERIGDSPSIMERCDLAREWNEKNPDMPITADELDIHEIILSRAGRMPTEEEGDAVIALPKSSGFGKFWQSLLELRGKIDRGEVSPE